MQTNTSGQSAPNRAAAQPVSSNNPGSPGGGMLYSSGIWGPVLFGVAGFALSVFLLLGWPGCNKGRFHEIDLQLARVDSLSLHALVDTLTVYRQQQESWLGKVIQNQNDKKQQVKITADTDAIKARIDSVDQLLFSLSLRKFNNSYGNRDTLRCDTITRFTIRRDTLALLLDTFKEKGSLTLGYYEPEFSKRPIMIPDSISIHSYSTSFDFFKKYPGFAFWAFIGILQMVMWSLMVPICISIYDKIRLLHKENKTVNRRGKSFLLAGAVLALFCLIVYLGVIDEDVITDKHFMNGFLGNLFTYSLIGYGVAFLCLSGYMYLADTLYQVQEKFKAGALRLR